MNWQFSNDAPIYAQLIGQIRAGIVSGAFSPGERLPSVRDLAMEAGVNPNTMQRALTELERDGLVYSQRTSGRYVTEDQTAIMEARHALAADRVRSFLTDMERLGFEKEDLLSLLRQESAPLRETVARAPLERLLVETDSPYVLPDIPWEGSRKSLGRVRNSSLLLPRIIEEIARLKRLPPETVEAAVLENTRRVFRLPDIKNGG